MNRDDEIVTHRVECEQCALEPRDCLVLQNLIQQRDVEIEMAILQPKSIAVDRAEIQSRRDDLIARRQENNPEYFPGSSTSPFFNLY